MITVIKNQHKKTLFSFMLLGVFLITFLHNFVPHSHNEHSAHVTQISVVDLEHSHSHGHSHNNDSENPQKNHKNLLHLLGNHSHFFHGHEQIILFSSRYDNINKPVNNDLLTVLLELKTFAQSQILKTTILHLRNYYNSTSLRGIPLRGPPTLG